VRRPIHQVVLFYVRTAIQKQHIINQELLKTVEIIRRKQDEIYQTQQAELKTLQDEICYLRQKLKVDNLEIPEEVVTHKNDN
jgi:hypothetical protein